MVSELFVNNGKEIVFLGGAKTSLAKKLNVSCLLKIGDIPVIIAGEENSSTKQ